VIDLLDKEEDETPVPVKSTAAAAKKTIHFKPGDAESFRDAPDYWYAHYHRLIQEGSVDPKSIASMLLESVIGLAESNHKYIFQLWTQHSAAKSMAYGTKQDDTRFRGLWEARDWTTELVDARVNEELMRVQLEDSHHNEARLHEEIWCRRR
jgi:hypothetical protein